MRALLAFGLLVAAFASFAVAAQARDAERFLGDWVGRYVCNQGETGLVLAIDKATEERNGAVYIRARFVFHAIDKNPKLPTGCFTLTGLYLPRSKSFTLIAGRWLRRPNEKGVRWVTVNLKGVVDLGAGRMSGTVVGYNCKTFTVKKKAARIKANDACYRKPNYAGWGRANVTTAAR